MLNYRMTAYILGSIAVITAGLMLVPFLMTFGYGEDLTSTTLGFGVTIAILLAAGVPCIVKKPTNMHITSSCGFITVALAWIMMGASALHQQSGTQLYRLLFRNSVGLYHHGRHYHDKYRRRAAKYIVLALDDALDRRHGNTGIRGSAAS